MKILHCLESLDSAAGGPARSVPQLALAQVALGDVVGLWAGAVKSGVGNPEAGDLADLDSVAAGRIRVLSGSFGEALQAFGKPDLVHDHGIWLPFHREIARTCHEMGIPRVVSPRGMLEPWALNHKKWKKRLAWWCYQRWDLNGAAGLHATAESEAEQLRRLGLTAPIEIVPNGVAVPLVEAGGDGLKAGGGGEFRAFPDAASRDLTSSRPRTVLFLSRIHPKKGLPMLLEAWERVRPAGWRLRIVGPDEGGHLGVLKRQCEGLGLDWGEDGQAVADCDRFSRPGVDEDRARANPDPSSDRETRTTERTVIFSPPVEGGAKWRAFQQADLFVLPTYSENFGIAVAEALASGVPVVTTTGTPWHGLLDHGCGWWVAAEVGALTGALEEALNLGDDQRQAMGARGREWMRRDFTWDGVARRMGEGYLAMLKGGPDCRNAINFKF